MIDFRQLFTVASVLISALWVTELHAADGFSVKDSEGDHADIVAPSGQPILRYVYVRDTSTPETTFDTAKVFTHVVAPNGTTTLTKGPGGKFPHHRGIFIGWSKLQHKGERHDLWHVRNTSQVHQKFVKTEGDETAGTLTSVIHWIGIHGKPIIEETRTHRVVQEDGAYAVIDFVSELKAVDGEVELNGDPEHAGIQFRPSQQVAENKSAKYVYHQDGLDLKKDNDLPWVAETFRVDDEAWTVQHMSHPSNPPAARWSAYRDYGRFGPFTVVKISDGESQTFRYRFRVTAGETPKREQFSEYYEGYAKGH